MVVYSILLSSLVIGLILCSLILCRKIPLFALPLSVLYWLSYLIKVVDPLYYNDLINLIASNDEMDVFLFTYSFFNFCVAFIEFLVLLILKMRRTRSRLDKALSSLELESNVIDYMNSLDDFYIVIYNDNYYLNKQAMNLLELKTSVISCEDIIKLINEDDIDAFKKNNYFRIKLINNYEWFERSVEAFQERMFNVIKRVKADNYSNITVGDFSSLEKKLNSLENNMIDYGVLLIHIMNIYNDKGSYYVEENDEIIRTIINGKYVVSIKDFFENNLINVYKLGSNEFAYVIEKKNTLSFIVNKLKINDNVLNDFIYFIDDKKYVVKTKVATVLSDSNNDIVSSIAKSLENVLLSDKNAYICDNVKSETNEKETSLDIKIDINKDII